MKTTQLGLVRRPRGLREIILSLFGNSAHLWMWDEGSLQNALAGAGFTDIRRVSFGDSSDLRFSDVEDPARFDGFLAMQCAKLSGAPASQVI